MHINSLSRTVMMLPILFIAVGVRADLRSAWADKQSPQAAHQHTAPHGGQMVIAGKYRLELVVKDHQEVQVYIYDDKTQPIPVPVQQATLYLRLPENKRQTLTLEAKGSSTASYLTTPADLHGVKAFEGALRIALDGEPRNVRFTYQEDHDGTPHKHSPGR